MADCPHEKMSENRLRKAMKIAKFMKTFDIYSTHDLDTLTLKNPRLSVLRMTGYDTASDATWKLVDQLLNFDAK